MKKIDQFEKLVENLRIRMLRNRFLERPNNIEKEIKLRNVIRKMINEMDRLKTELKKKEEFKKMEEFKTNELFLDLDYVRIDILDDVILIETKLENLGISKAPINAIKKSIV